MTYRSLFLSFICSVMSYPALADLKQEKAQQEPIFLEQNWSEKQRSEYYSLSQGSQIMPYSWALALEKPESKTWLFAGGLEKHGYIPNPKSDWNPDGFPVGFIKDSDPSSGDWIGMNCSACHTNQITHNKVRMQIDGAPARADMYGFLVEVRDSIRATIVGKDKFDRFARKVLGKDYSPSNALTLLGKLKDFGVYWDDYVKASTSKVKWGHTRLDAFGMIYNRVSAIDLHMPQNNRTPNAPVSYPFLWGASYENVVQWNGSAPNYNKNILIADLQRLGRNVGEVLGVFANTDIKKPSLLHPYYVTTARRINQFHLEEHLMNLWSPVWPEKILGKIDIQKAARGEKLFQKNCVSCHTIIPHGKQDTPVTVTMTPLNEIGTDRTMAENACGRMVDSGILEGVKMPPLIGKALPKKTKTLDLVANVTIGAILNPHLDSGPTNSLKETTKTPSKTERIKNLFGAATKLRNSANLEEEERKALVQKLSGYLNNKKPAPAECSDSNPLMAYKGRPLDGIWATAPYLHNGSVPNLYELLLPADKRTKRFKVGSTEYDPKHVGFTTKNGPFELNTKLPGNSNAGHDTYGNATFTEEERWALVEYLKTL